MPGRFTLTTDATELRTAFPWLTGIPDDFRPRYNIAPQQPLTIVLNDGQHKIDFLNWGFIPSFSSGAKMTNLLINARSEGIAKTPSFRGPFKRRRCLVLADGYYEWVKVPRKKEKLAYRVMLKTRHPFAFAGVWDSWQSMDGSEIKTCAVITCEPNALVSQIHHRMGVILRDQDYEKWLRPSEADPKELKPLLAPYPAEDMLYYPVSTLVSNARNDSPECIKAIGNEVTI